MGRDIAALLGRDIMVLLKMLEKRLPETIISVSSPVAGEDAAFTNNNQTTSVRTLFVVCAYIQSYLCRKRSVAS